MEQYDEVRQLGKGSFGSVFLVRERAALRRTWVMKRVPLRSLSSLDRKCSFQEVKLLQSLRHPHICSYHESFVHKASDTLCIIMQYCDGGDLHSYAPLPTPSPLQAA